MAALASPQDKKRAAFSFTLPYLPAFSILCRLASAQFCWLFCLLCISAPVFSAGKM
jgi:hypothetical protein